jgi:hypothetical protein
VEFLHTLRRSRFGRAAGHFFPVVLPRCIPGLFFYTIGLPCFPPEFLSGAAREPPPDQLDDVIVQRTRVRLLFRHSKFGQHVENRAGLDFKLARQLVDPLLHK